MCLPCTTAVWLANSATRLSFSLGRYASVRSSPQTTRVFCALPTTAARQKSINIVTNFFMSGRFLVAYMAKLAIIFRIRNSKLGIFMFVINVLQKAEMVECNKKSNFNGNGTSNTQHGQHQ